MAKAEFDCPQKLWVSDNCPRGADTMARSVGAKKKGSWSLPVTLCVLLVVLAIGGHPELRTLFAVPDDRRADEPLPELDQMVEERRLAVVDLAHAAGGTSADFFARTRLGFAAGAASCAGGAGGGAD